MPYIAWIIEIFNEPQAPFSVAEITRRLKQLYSHRITSEEVYRAIRALRSRAATAEKVAPLDDARPALYSADAAQRIARHVTRDMEPERLQMPPKVAHEVSKEKTSTSSHLPGTLDATTPEERLAA